jgi:hypothetical protein
VAVPNCAGCPITVGEVEAAKIFISTSDQVPPIDQLSARSTDLLERIQRNLKSIEKFEENNGDFSLISVMGHRRDHPIRVRHSLLSRCQCIWNLALPDSVSCGEVTVLDHVMRGIIGCHWAVTAGRGATSDMARVTVPVTAGVTPATRRLGS